MSIFKIEHSLLELALTTEESLFGYNIFIEVMVEIEHEAGSDGGVLRVLISEFHGTLQVVVMPWIIPLVIGRMRATTTLCVVFDQINNLLVITDSLTKSHFLLIFDQLGEILALLGVEYSALLFHGDLHFEFLGRRQLEIPVLLITNIANLLKVILES